MKLLNRIKPLYFWPVVAILILIFFLLPLKITYKIKTPGKILSAKEWVITKGTDGQLITMLMDNKLGVFSNYSVSQFDRGDAGQFIVHPGIYSGSVVNENDTIASIYSNEIERQFIELKGDIEIARASLFANVTGEKEAIIKEETQRLEFMKKQAEENRKIYNRLKALYEKNLVTLDEFEIARGTAELSEINISIAESHLKTVETGVKKEMSDLIKTQIQSLEQELKILQQRFNNYVITSKISGVITRVSVGDTLLAVYDNKDYLIMLPIKWEEKKYLDFNNKIVINSPSVLKNLEGEIIEINNTVKILNGSQIFVATAALKNSLSDLTPGLIVQCLIECDEISPYEYLKRVITSTL